MTTATVPAAPAAAPARTHPHPRARGWIPASDIDWLEGLRAEHERAIEVRLETRAAVPALEHRGAELRVEHAALVAEAALAGVDPPPFPGRLGEDYERVQREKATADADAAEVALGGLIARVRAAISEHRLGDEWKAATTGEDGSSPALREFECQWNWPSNAVRDIAAERAAADAEVKAATEALQRLMDGAQGDLAEWGTAVAAAEAAGEPRPAERRDEGLIVRSDAQERLERAIAARNHLSLRVAAV